MIGGKLAWSVGIALMLLLQAVGFGIGTNPVYANHDLGSAGSDQGQSREARMEVSKFNEVHLPFIENWGQINAKVKFYTNTFSGTVYVTDDGLTYAMHQQGEPVKERFLTQEMLHPRGIDKSDTIVNYFVGEKENWRSNVPTYNTVELGEVWPSIHVELRAYGKNIEKVFKVNPGGRADEIRLAVEGARSLKIDEDGKLLLETDLGIIAMEKPYAYQDIGGIQKPVAVTYLVNEMTYGFAIGHHDPKYMTVIDPLLSRFVSTFIGGSVFDFSFAITIDSTSNVFVTGFTESDDYPTTDGVPDKILDGQMDIFISKFNNDLTTLLASTFIGGSNDDLAYSIAIDISDNVLVTGSTTSADFPTTGGVPYITLDINGDNRDVFISKFNNDLTTLLASTFLGGFDDDIANGIAIDSTGNIFVTGHTSSGGEPLFSKDFPTTPNAYDTVLNEDSDGFISKFNNDLTTLLASTFLGGNGDGFPDAIAIDSTGNILVTGSTTSADFPITSNAYDKILDGQQDIFISKFNNDLTALLASTFLGGSITFFLDAPHKESERDLPTAIAIDSTGNIFVTGSTDSHDFPITPSAADQHFEQPWAQEGFISKFNNDLTTLLASTFIGGDHYDIAYSIAIDSSDAIFVTGSTESANFLITDGAYDETFNVDALDNVFISKFNNDLTTLLASTFLGGSSFANDAFGIAIDNSGNVFVTGYTTSDDYPTSDGAYDRIFNGDRDAFVSSLANDLAKFVKIPKFQGPVAINKFVLIRCLTCPPEDIILESIVVHEHNRLEFAIVSPPKHGKLSIIMPVDNNAARVTYTPDREFAVKDIVGRDMFKFVVIDGKKISSSGSVHIYMKSSD